MPVFVDDMLMQASVKCGSRYISSRWSHLTASTTEELHVFAARLGMRRAWFQPAKLVADTEYTRTNCPDRIGKPFPGSRDHYDLTEAKRDEAIKLGAIAVHWGCEPWRDRRRDEREADEIFNESRREQARTNAEAEEAYGLELNCVVSYEASKPTPPTEVQKPAPEKTLYVAKRDGSDYGT
jgi:hypothetical protein